MAGTATARAAAIASSPKTAPRSTDAYKAGHPEEEDGWACSLYQESIDLRKFHEEDNKTPYTRTKRHTQVLLLLIILINNLYDDDDDVDAVVGEVGVDGSCSCCSTLSAIERTWPWSLWIFASF